MYRRGFPRALPDRQSQGYVQTLRYGFSYNARTTNKPIRTNRYHGDTPRVGSEQERLKKVLFVCTANICRNPMAEAIFHALAEDRGLAFRAESAGTAALVGKTIAPNAAEALEEIGVYPGDHHARQVDEAMLEGSDLILTMTPRHVRALREFRPDPGPAGHEKVFTLPEYATGGPSDEMIPDPYGYTMSAYRSSVRQLLEYVEQLMERLKE